MKFHFSPYFQRRYKKLDKRVKEDFLQSFTKFQNDPFAPSLKTHKLKNVFGLWSFRINYSNRVLFRFVGEDVELVNIGDHSIYE